MRTTIGQEVRIRLDLLFHHVELIYRLLHEPKEFDSRVEARSLEVTSREQWRTQHDQNASELS